MFVANTVEVTSSVSDRNCAVGRVFATTTLLCMFVVNTNIEWKLPLGSLGIDQCSTDYMTVGIPSPLQITMLRHGIVHSYGGIEQLQWSSICSNHNEPKGAASSIFAKYKNGEANPMGFSQTWNFGWNVCANPVHEQRN